MSNQTEEGNQTESYLEDISDGDFEIEGSEGILDEEHILPSGSNNNKTVPSTGNEKKNIFHSAKIQSPYIGFRKRRRRRRRRKRSSKKQKTLNILAEKKGSVISKVSNPTEEGNQAESYLEDISDGDFEINEGNNEQGLSSQKQGSQKVSILNELDILPSGSNNKIA